MSWSSWRRHRASQQRRAQIIAAARELSRRGLVSGTLGNVSARFEDGMLITPTRRDYSRLERRDIVRLGRGGAQQRGGSHVPSREWRLHAAIYEARSDVAAIAHTHSPYAIARSFDSIPIIVETEERDYLQLDRIPVVPAMPAGTPALARAVIAALGARQATLLARHGAIVLAQTPAAAVELATAVEHQAQIDCLRCLATQTRMAARAV